MGDEKPKNSGPLSKISEKVAALIGSGLAILSGASTVDAKAVMPNAPADAISTTVGSSLVKTLPPKLTIKQFRTGFKMIAQHDSHTSHSSHDSHASHDSHDSHSSHDSHASHDSHTSHTSHVSGGFV
jgi:hypothetical protein